MGNLAHSGLIVYESEGTFYCKGRRLAALLRAVAQVLHYGTVAVASITAKDSTHEHHANLSHICRAVRHRRSNLAFYSSANKCHSQKVGAAAGATKAKQSLLTGSHFVTLGVPTNQRSKLCIGFGGLRSI